MTFTPPQDKTETTSYLEQLSPECGSRAVHRRGAESAEGAQSLAGLNPQRDPGALGGESDAAFTQVRTAIDVRKESRFGVVMYGGVSLAIYINGIAQEAA